MKKFVFTAFFAICSIGFAASNDLCEEFDSVELVSENFVQSIAVEEYIVNEDRCYGRTCYYRGEQLLGCTAWKEISCTFDGGTLDPVIITAPRN